MNAAGCDAELASCLLGFADVQTAWLYGSTARGTAGAASDLDLAVLLERCPPRTLAGLPTDIQFAIEERVGGRADVVVLNDAPVDLVHRVLRDGRLLVDRNRSARVAFEVRARREYFDLLPILRRYRRLDPDLPRRQAPR